MWGLHGCPLTLSPPHHLPPSSPRKHTTVLFIAVPGGAAKAENEWKGNEEREATIGAAKALGGSREGNAALVIIFVILLIIIPPMKGHGK
jgi:hypothetical protein